MEMAGTNKGYIRASDLTAEAREIHRQQAIDWFRQQAEKELGGDVTIRVMVPQDFLESNGTTGALPGQAVQFSYTIGADNHTEAVVIGGAAAAAAPAQATAVVVKDDTCQMLYGFTDLDQVIMTLFVHDLTNALVEQLNLAIEKGRQNLQDPMILFKNYQDLYFKPRAGYNVGMYAETAFANRAGVRCPFEIYIAEKVSLVADRKPNLPVPNAK